MGTTTALPYDPASRRSIVEYAHLLVGSTLREQTGVASIANPQRRKGSFGNAVEEHFFGYAPNSAARADFPQAGLELKTTPLKRAKRGGYVAKERLVFCMLNFGSVVDETFETSTLLAKCSDILLISYLWEPEVDPLDYVIQIADEWTLPAQDMPQFKRDWETVVAKVRAGRAHEISGSDTLYLEACTKGKDLRKRRTHDTIRPCMYETISPNRRQQSWRARQYMQRTAISMPCLKRHCSTSKSPHGTTSEPCTSGLQQATWHSQAHACTARGCQG